MNGLDDVPQRTRAARDAAELAELAQDDRAGEQARASVGNAVLAGIAAGDALCCARPAGAGCGSAASV